jgi:hypothetical protein
MRLYTGCYKWSMHMQITSRNSYAKYTWGFVSFKTSLKLLKPFAVVMANFSVPKDSCRFYRHSQTSLQRVNIHISEIKLYLFVTYHTRIKIVRATAMLLLPIFEKNSVLFKTLSGHKTSDPTFTDNRNINARRKCTDFYFYFHFLSRHKFTGRPVR